MTGIDILLIVIGAILVAVSFAITEKISGHEIEKGTGREIWSDRDEMTIKDRVNIVLADKSEQIINNTDERLCHLSNEKIMEFQEFSEQINEKLNENHNQSVFLYKMLTEKQNEMKEWMSEIDSKYAGIKNELNTIEAIIEKMKQLGKKEPVREKKPARTKEAKEITQITEITAITANKGIDDSKNESAAAGTSKVSRPVPAANKKDMPQSSKAAPVADGKNVSKPNVSKPQKALMSNRNEKILELFDSGKSLVEVSKQLGMGQGEVKLVLDLYRGNKK